MSLDVYLTAMREVEVFDCNITHNLNRMAKEAGLYQALWRPEELGVKYAKDLVMFLEDGLAILESDPDRFKKFNPINGWGNYDNLYNFTCEYLEACKENPDAKISVSR